MLLLRNVTSVWMIPARHLPACATMTCEACTTARILGLKIIIDMLIEVVRLLKTKSTKRQLKQCTCIRIKTCVHLIKSSCTRWSKHIRRLLTPPHALQHALGTWLGLHADALIMFDNALKHLEAESRLGNVQVESVLCLFELPAHLTIYRHGHTSVSGRLYSETGHVVWGHIKGLYSRMQHMLLPQCKPFTNCTLYAVRKNHIQANHKGKTV